MIAERNTETAIVLGFQNLSDFVFWSVFEFHRSGRRLDAIGDGVGVKGFELGNMEHRMNAL